MEGPGVAGWRRGWAATQMVQVTGHYLQAKAMELANGWHQDWFDFRQIRKFSALSSLARPQTNERYERP